MLEMQKTYTNDTIQNNITSFYKLSLSKPKKISCICDIIVSKQGVTTYNGISSTLFINLYLWWFIKLWSVLAKKYLCNRKNLSDKGHGYCN